MFKIARASGIAFLLAFWALAAPSPVFPADKNQQAAVEGISNTLDEAIKSYGEGDVLGAKGKIADAYFQYLRGKRHGERHSRPHRRGKKDIARKDVFGTAAWRNREDTSCRACGKKDRLIFELTKDAATLERRQAALRLFS